MEQIKEAVYLINDERYLHLRENGIALSGTDEVAVCAVRIAAGLGLSTEIGCSSNDIVGNGGVGELIHRLGHFDYGECHAVGHGE